MPLSVSTKGALPPTPEHGTKWHANLQDLAGEKDTSIPFCKWLCDGTTEGLGTIFLVVQQMTINLDDMIELFSRLKTRKEVKGQGEVL
jgi:hypothetical protein